MSWTKLAFIITGAVGLGCAAVSGLRRRRSPNLQGQVVAITGGSRGLGLQVAREFASQGCRIAICARDPHELKTARQDLASRTSEVLATSCDVTDVAQVERWVREVAGRFGQIDILVNVAGMIQVGPAVLMKLEDYQRAMDVNFWGTVHATLAVLPDMLDRRAGRIVNITSIGGRISVPHLLPYSCAKFAAVGFSEGLRVELARHGITVTTVLPGLMRTGSMVKVFFKGRQELEYAMFAPVAGLPLVTISAQSAARQIVAAARGGQAERVLGLPAKLLALAHGLFPAVVSDVLTLVARALPAAPPEERGARRGDAVRDQLQSPLLDLLTLPGLSAGHRLNQDAQPQSMADAEAGS